MFKRKTHDPSVFAEPHLREVLGSAAAARPCPMCGYNLEGLTGSSCPECGADELAGDEESAAEHSVWDEPVTSGDLAGAAPADAARYGAWLESRAAATSVAESWFRVFLLSLGAGPWAVLGAMWGGGQTWVSILALVLVGPMVEESMKLATAAWAIERRPFWFKSAAQITVCAAVSGLVFASLENLLYLNVYIDNPSRGMAVWRWTVCVALHAGCSVIASLGLVRVWNEGRATGKRPDLARATPPLYAAITIHGTYNLLAVLFQGAMNF